MNAEHAEVERATVAGAAGRERNVKGLTNANHQSSIVFVFARPFSFRTPLRGLSRAVIFRVFRVLRAFVISRRLGSQLCEMI